MKRNTIKWKIFKYNLVLIISMLILIAVVFNIAIRVYIEKDLLSQLNIIASQAEKAALQQGPNFTSKPRAPKPESQSTPDNGSIRYHFNLERSIREPLSVLNADYLLLDKDMQIITPLPDELSSQNDLSEKIVSEIKSSDISFYDTNLSFQISDSNYIAIIKPVSEKNNFGLGWLIIYSSLQKVNQLQYVINIILFIILLFSAIITVLLSSFVAKKISTPFSSMNKHIRALAERNFDNKIQLPVDDEFRELVNNINLMSEKLETHDLAQKTFLQNASHEFRTPLMSIQSYAEGIKYNVIDEATAVDIIISESQRMTRLVEDLLYLSRLDAIEEHYSQNDLNLNELIKSCINRVNSIAIKKGIQINFADSNEIVAFKGDEEKLSRAIINIISNCIRYAKNYVEVTLGKNNGIEIVISDDGPGFDKNELPNIFERFYKGKKGNYGLGLAISRSVLEKYKGNITASNGDKGAIFKITLFL